jgi:hypothetical protein
LNIFQTHPVLPYDFCQFVSVLVCFYQERRRDTAFLFGQISAPSKKNPLWQNISIANKQVQVFYDGLDDHPYI